MKHCRAYFASKRFSLTNMNGEQLFQVESCPHFWWIIIDVGRSVFSGEVPEHCAFYSWVWFRNMLCQVLVFIVTSIFWCFGVLVCVKLFHVKHCREVINSYLLDSPFLRGHWKRCHSRAWRGNPFAQILRLQRNRLSGQAR